MQQTLRSREKNRQSSLPLPVPWFPPLSRIRRTHHNLSAGLEGRPRWPPCCRRPPLLLPSPLPPPLPRATQHRPPTPWVPKRSLTGRTAHPAAHERYCQPASQRTHQSPPCQVSSPKSPLLPLPLLPPLLLMTLRKRPTLLCSGRDRDRGRGAPPKKARESSYNCRRRRPQR